MRLILSCRLRSVRRPLDRLAMQHSLEGSRHSANSHDWRPASKARQHGKQRQFTMTKVLKAGVCVASSETRSMSLAQAFWMIRLAVALALLALPLQARGADNRHVQTEQGP